MQSKRDKALSVALNVSETFCKGATGCGVVGVESAAGLLLALILQLKAVKENSDTYKELISEISTLTTLLDSVLDDIGRPRTQDERAAVARLGSEKEFTTRVDGLRDTLQKVTDEATKLEVRKGVLMRFLSANPNKDRLKSMADTVKKATEDFKFRSGFAVEILVRDLKLKVERDQAEEVTKAQLARDREEQLAREARERQERLEREARERKENLDREARAQEAQRNERERLDAKIKQCLVDLRPANAPYSSRGHSGPLKDTCVAVMRDINEWATDPNQQPPFYVLTGGAGTGKSTVAYGIAESAHRRCGGGVPGQLAASFFFARGGAGLDSTDAVFHTLAAQMLSRIPSLRPFAIPIVEEYLALTGAPNLAVQSEYLFEKLLANLPNNHPPLLIVIDGLDECNAATQENVQLMLYLMLQCIRRVDCAVRVFVTSRPDVHIEHAFSAPPFVDASCPPSDTSLRRFHMHHIPRSVVDAEITQFFALKLCGVGGLRKAARDALFRDYPNAIQALTTLAAGLFIYAATIVPYLLKHIGEDILGGVAPLFADVHKAPQSALEHLGQLYAVVLEQALVGAPDRRSAESAMIAVLGCLAVAQDHLSPDALAVLTHKHLKQDILPTLHRLAPVVFFDPEKPDVAVRPLHASFPEFLVDNDRCRPPYFVAAHRQHLHLAIRTLKLLTVPATVALYISHLNHSSRPLWSSADINSSTSEVVPNAMRYACTYWPAHVIPHLDSALTIKPSEAHSPNRASDPGFEQLVHDYESAVSTFFHNEHIVRWIEVLGYLRILGTALNWLPALRRVFSDIDKSLAEKIYDAYRLVVAFYPVLVEDPRQLYISALPQCPDPSPLRAYIPITLPLPQSLLPYPAWSASVTHKSEQLPPKTPLGRNFRWLIRPSPDGRWVATSLRSGPGRRGDIHLRDATTGILLRTLHIHAFGLADLGISSDSRFIVSATFYGHVCITDSSSGVVVATFNHTDGNVTRVAFRCKDSEVLLVHTTHHGVDRPVKFLILEWDRTERAGRELRPKEESRGLRKDTLDDRFPQPWSISPTGRWGVLWATGDLIDTHSFDEVRLPFIDIVDTSNPRTNIWRTRTCGTWLSATALVCSIPRKDGCSLIVVDIGQDITEIEQRPTRSLPTPYEFRAMEASAGGSLVALYGSSHLDSGSCIYLWDPDRDEIRFFKHIHTERHIDECDFCLSPLGDALFLAVDTTWSVIPISESPIATLQSIHSAALKFSDFSDDTSGTIMVSIMRPVDGFGWEAGILSREYGFWSDSTVVGRDYFRVCRHDELPVTVHLTPNPESMILCGRDVILYSSPRSSVRFTTGDRQVRTTGYSRGPRLYPGRWTTAGVSPDRSLLVAAGLRRENAWVTFAVWDTRSTSLLHAFRTPRSPLPNGAWDPEDPDGINRTYRFYLPDWMEEPKYPHTEIIVTDDRDIYFLLGHYSFAFPASEWSTSNLDEPPLLALPEPGPVPDEWFQIRDDGWVSRSDAHPEVRTRGQERLFWIPPSQRVGEWRGHHHLLAMTTEYDVIVLDLSDFDDDTKEQLVPRLQTENE